MTIEVRRTGLLLAVASLALLSGAAVAATENDRNADTTVVDLAADAPAAAGSSAQAGVQVAQASPIGHETVTVTARRREENVQDVPLAISVVPAATLADTGAFNVNRLTQLQPSLQFFTQNPRNTSVNIRGIGAPLGLTNDGIEQGVGIYVDQVYYNRVASSTLDFIDVDQIEVLRGPQGTLYGKNTTAVAHHRPSAKSIRASQAKPATVSKPGKIDKIIAMMRRHKGASIGDLTKATAWQSHSVRGAISGTLRKKQGLNVVSEKSGNVRLYRITDKAVG